MDHKPCLSLPQVFNMNAPVPPSSDGQVDALKPPAQFPGGYAQGFGSQAESAVDQADIPQDTLQSGEAGGSFTGTAVGHPISSLYIPVFSKTKNFSQALFLLTVSIEGCFVFEP